MKGADRSYFSYSRQIAYDTEFEILRGPSAKIVRQSDQRYASAYGYSSIKNDLLCETWLDFGDDYCVAIFRNPDGTPETKDEFLFFCSFFFCKTQTQHNKQ